MSLILLLKSSPHLPSALWKLVATVILQWVVIVLSVTHYGIYSRDGIGAKWLLNVSTVTVSPFYSAVVVIVLKPHHVVTGFECCIRGVLNSLIDAAGKGFDHSAPKDIRCVLSNHLVASHRGILFPRTRPFLSRRALKAWVESR